MAGRKVGDDDTADMSAGHQRFKLASANERDFYRSLTSGEQRPRLLWIGCADAPVVPDEIAGAESGRLLVIRNVGNVVPPAHFADASVGAAIEYAVMHLKVDDIVVCGHTQCGAIAALGEEVNEAIAPHFEHWLRFARGCHDLVRAQRVPEAEAEAEATRANVLFQVDHLKTYDCVRKGVDKGRIRLHGWLSDTATGELFAYHVETGDWRPLSGTG